MIVILVVTHILWPYSGPAIANTDKTDTDTLVEDQDMLQPILDSVLYKPGCPQDECTYLTRGMEMPAPPPPKPKPVPTKPVQLVAAPTGYDPCSCVSYAKWKSGINVGPIGLAKYYPINSLIPIVGAIVITSESAAGHNAVVTAIDSQYIYVTEANYIRCKVGTRKIPINSSVIRGYYTNLI